MKPVRGREPCAGRVGQPGCPPLPGRQKEGTVQGGGRSPRKLNSGSCEYPFSSFFSIAPSFPFPLSSLPPSPPSSFQHQLHKPCGQPRRYNKLDMARPHERTWRERLQIVPNVSLVLTIHHRNYTPFPGGSGRLFTAIPEASAIIIISILRMKWLSMEPLSKLPK